MLERIKLYDAIDLEEVVAEGCSVFADKAAWVRKLLGSFAAIVRCRPLAYRSFGPFWWPIKVLMIQSGDYQGEAPDPDLVAQVTLGSAELDVAAAWSNHEAYSSQMLSDSTFTVDTEDGDTIEYQLYDDELERRAIG